MKPFRPPGCRMVWNRLSAPGQQLVHVGLVAYIEEEPSIGRVEDVVHGQRQLDHTEIRPEVAAGLRKAADQKLADLLRKFGEFRDRHLLDVGGRLNRTEMFTHRGNHVLDAAERKTTRTCCLGPAASSSFKYSNLRRLLPASASQVRGISLLQREEQLAPQFGRLALA